MHPTATLLGLGLAEAPHAAAQPRVRALAQEMFAGAGFDAAAHADLFESTGIERRTFALPLEAYADGLDARSRNAAYLEVAPAMLDAAARGALGASDPARVTHVVTVSSTGVATPSLECRLIEELGLPPDVRRVPVFGLGCAGGVAGLQIASDLAASRPDGRVLLLCVELCSLTLFRQDRSLRNFVACALFGDGAAACLVGAPGVDEEAALLTLGQGHSRLFEDSLDLMGWDVHAEGWRVVFSPRIPDLVRTEIAGLVRRASGGRRPEHFVLHPGGRKILEAYEASLELAPAELEPARDTLREVGNLSAATVFFVLEHVLARGPTPGATGVLCAFGPGFSADLVGVEFGSPVRR